MKPKVIIITKKIIHEFAWLFHSCSYIRFYFGFYRIILGCCCCFDCWARRTDDQTCELDFCAQFQIGLFCMEWTVSQTACLLVKDTKLDSISAHDGSLFSLFHFHCSTLIVTTTIASQMWDRMDFCENHYNLTLFWWHFYEFNLNTLSTSVCVHSNILFCIGMELSMFSINSSHFVFDNKAELCGNTIKA